MKLKTEERLINSFEVVAQTKTVGSNSESTVFPVNKLNLVKKGVIK